MNSKNLKNSTNFLNFILYKYQLYLIYMEQKPEKGKILISEPFLNDPNFKRTIILLTEHSEEGSVGFILNKRTDLTFNQALDEFPRFDAPIFFGGPVQLNALQFIHRAGNIVEGTLEIAPGLFWGGNFESLKDLIEAKHVNPRDFKFFIGYSGWDECQLMDEMKIGSWIVADSKLDDIFSDEPDQLWRDVLKNMGKKYAILASFPENPSVN